MATWADLLHDILVKIARGLTSYEDFVYFGGVCSSWRLAATKENFNRSLQPQVPWLMLSEKTGQEEEEEEENWREFFVPSRRRIYKVLLPEASKRRCLSSRGWLLTVGRDKINVNLLHPLSRVRIELPNLNTLPDHEDDVLDDLLHYIKKMVLSSSPSWASDYIVMVSYGPRGQLAFWKPGNTVWTAADICPGSFFDINYYNGKLYAVNSRGGIVQCDLDGPIPTEVQIVSTMPYRNVRLVERLYIVVESSEKFFIVSREGFLEGWGEVEDGRHEIYGTNAFRIFQLNLSNGRNDREWSEVKDLGNRALFLGYNSSFFIEVTEINGCKANSIYFTDDCAERYITRLKNLSGGGEDMGIYNLLDGSFEPHYDGKSYSLVTPPIWVEPSF